MINKELEEIKKDILPLTYNHFTSHKAHDVLTEITLIQCEINKAPYYGLEMTDEIKAKIKISN